MEMLGEHETLRAAGEVQQLETSFAAAYREMRLAIHQQWRVEEIAVYHPDKTAWAFCTELGYCKYCWKQLELGDAYETMSWAPNKTNGYPYHTDTLCAKCVCESSLETMMHSVAITNGF